MLISMPITGHNTEKKISHNARNEGRNEEKLNMNLENEMMKAEVLIEALPYIQKFNRKIIVVKYGGSAG